MWGTCSYAHLRPGSLFETRRSFLSEQWNPLAFKRGPAFIQIRRLLEEIRYALHMHWWIGLMGCSPPLGNQHGIAKTIRKIFLQKFNSSMDGLEKCTETRQRWKNARSLHVQKYTDSRFRVAFLLSFISALFLYLFQVYFYLMWSLQERFFLLSALFRGS